MSATRIIIASLPSFCQNYQNWWKFDEVLAKTILYSFLRHDVVQFGYELICQNCIRYYRVYADALSLVRILFYSFLFLIPLSGQNLRSLLLHGNKRDRIETLTQCAERSQFVVDCFFRHSDLIYWGFRSPSISSTANISSSSQLFIAVSQQGRRRFSERESSRLRRRPRVSLRQN